MKLVQLSHSSFKFIQFRSFIQYKCLGFDRGFFFFFPLLWSGLIGDVWVFVPVGFWWLIWVDRRWRKHWSSGGGVWVLIGVDLGFFLFFLLWLGLIDDVWVFGPMGFWWLIDDGGNTDLAAAMSGCWSGFFFFFF